MAEFQELAVVVDDEFNSLFAYLFDLLNGGRVNSWNAFICILILPRRGGRNEMLILWNPKNGSFQCNFNPGGRSFVNRVFAPDKSCRAIQC